MICVNDTQRNDSFLPFLIDQFNTLRALALVVPNCQITIFNDQYNKNKVVIVVLMLKFLLLEL